MNITSISKKELIIKLMNPTEINSNHYRKLKKYYFDDQTLSRIGISREEYARIRIFNFNFTRKIIKEFDL